MAGLFRALLESFTGKAERPVYSTVATSGSRYASAPTPARVSANSGTGVVMREVLVTGVQRETADAVTLHFEPVGSEPLHYRAGQFLTFVVEIQGEQLRRAYSFSSSPLDDSKNSLGVFDRNSASVTIKRMPEGRVSSYLNERIAVGSILKVMGPSGEFCLAPASIGDPGRSFVFIAGGSGITPIFGLIQTLLRSEPGVDVTLLYGNRGPSDIIFREPLAVLARQYPNLQIKHVLDEPGPANDLEGGLEIAATGMLTGELILSLIGMAGKIGIIGDPSGSDESNRQFFICGPEAMMDGATAVLLDSGVADTSIHTERFTAPARRTTAIPTETYPIRFANSSRTVMPEVGQTILEAGLGAGLPLSYSCAMGGCAACKVKVISGSAVMAEPNCLSRAERDEGYVLACVACAATALEVEA